MNKKRLRNILTNLMFIAAFIFFMSFTFSAPWMGTSELTYNEFLEKIDEGKVESVEITEDNLNIKMIGENKIYHTGAIEYEKLIDILYDADISFKKVEEKTSNLGSMIFTLFVNFAPLIFIFYFFSKALGSAGNGIMSAGKSKATLNIDKDTGVTFADVAGQEEAKEQLTEIIDFLHNPKKYNDIGAKIPKGALLVGPPGTGKTLMAKAVAGEAHVPFFSVTGSDFIEMYVGVGASRIRDMFEKAKEIAPCIIFIDEVDSIAKTRDGGGRMGGNDEREQTLNQLLSEMDGFDSSKGIIILAATNRPDSLDKAFLRAGRFDRKIIVERPDFKGRVETLKVHSKNVKLDDSVDFKSIAYATTGSVGADLENIVNEAALRAVKFNRKAVTQEDLMDAVETVFAGKEKKDRVMSEKERRLVAFHEVGHAVVAAMQTNSSPVQKITIVPRTKGSLGYTLQIPEEEKFLSSKTEMLEEITTLLGGRSAEEVIFNTITTGASNDIERATNIARQMVTIYGMSDEFDMMALESIQNRYLDGTAVKNCSETTYTSIDNKVLEIIKKCHIKAKKIISENIPLMEEVANYLLDKESITGDEFMDIFHKYYPDRELKVTTIEDLEKTSTHIVKEEPVSKTSTKPAEPSRRHHSINIDKKETVDVDPLRALEEPSKKEKANPEVEKEESPLDSQNQNKESSKKKPEKEHKEEKTNSSNKTSAPKPEENSTTETKEERPTASVISNKKNKKKNKATVSDMQELLASVQSSKKPLYEESKKEQKPKESVKEEPLVKVASQKKEPTVETAPPKKEPVVEAAPPKKEPVVEAAPPKKEPKTKSLDNVDFDLDSFSEDMY